MYGERLCRATDFVKAELTHTPPWGPLAGKAKIDDYDPGPSYSGGGAARGGGHAVGVSMVANLYDLEIASQGAGSGALETPELATRAFIFNSRAFL